MPLSDCTHNCQFAEIVSLFLNDLVFMVNGSVTSEGNSDAQNLQLCMLIFLLKNVKSNVKYATCRYLEQLRELHEAYVILSVRSFPLYLS
jgi:hypothetical protein